MANDLQDQLGTVAQAMGFAVTDRVQALYNDHKKFLSGRQIQTPVEVVTLCDENFPYWIKLETPDPTRPGEWVGAVAGLLVPVLNAGMFTLQGYRFNDARAKSLLDVPNLLRNPNCIHKNLRHGHRGTGSIEGRHVYVHYGKDNQRKVAFVTTNPHRGFEVLVSSFWTNPGWVADCADFPALYVRPGATCTCCKNSKTTPKGGSAAPITPGPE